MASPYASEYLGWLLVLGIGLLWYGYRTAGMILTVAGALPLLLALLKDRRRAKDRAAGDRFRSGLAVGIHMGRERQ